MLDIASCMQPSREIWCLTLLSLSSSHVPSQDVIELSTDDMAKIAAIDKNKRFNDASTSFGYVFFADEKPAYKSALDAITNAGLKAKQAALQAAGKA